MARGEWETRRRGALLHVRVTAAIDAREAAAMVDDIAAQARQAPTRVIALDLSRAGIATPVQACLVGAALSFLPAVPLTIVLPRWGQLVADQVQHTGPVEHFAAAQAALSVARSIYLGGS